MFTPSPVAVQSLLTRRGLRNFCLLVAVGLVGLRVAVVEVLVVIFR
jgi:hypothetical protein